VLGCLLSSLKGEGPRHYPYSEMEHTDLLFLCLRKMDGVNQQPLNVAGVKVLVDELANLDPVVLEG
jgi:hypothetical protein